jgi:hypothetical protein
MGVLRVRINNAWQDVEMGSGPPGPVGPQGPAGPEAPATPWTALASLYQNGWSNYGGSYQVGRYRSVRDICYIEGLLTVGTFNVNAFVLPVGFRPVYSHQFVGVSNGTVSGAWRIDNTGAFIPFAGAGNLQINCSFGIGYGY